MPEAARGPAATADVMVGRSPQMLEVYKAIGRVAPQDVTVLIRGESGTGKELIARAIYQHSHAQRQAVPGRQLRGDSRDAAGERAVRPRERARSPGPTSRRIGKFEQCYGGTLFLDEVGDMPPLMQSKLLRLLQEQRFERVGGNETIQTDVRIIAATNRDLEAMVADGTFRADLYYRLNGFTIKLPPLRERGDDIAAAGRAFPARSSAASWARPCSESRAEALELLLRLSLAGQRPRAAKRAPPGAAASHAARSCCPSSCPRSSASRRLTASEHFRKAAAAARRDEPLAGFNGFIEERLKHGTNDLYAETIELIEKHLVARVLQHTSGNQSRGQDPGDHAGQPAEQGPPAPHQHRSDGDRGGVTPAA